MTPEFFASAIHDLGPIGLIAIIFAETGLLIGFFLPGDSLLVTAGVLASPAPHKLGGINIHLNLGVVLIGCFVAATVGAQVGYLIGQKAGPALFSRPKSQAVQARVRREGPGVLRALRQP